MLNLSELTDKVRALAIEAGDFIREERKIPSRGNRKKHAHDYVSYVDKESEKDCNPPKRITSRGWFHSRRRQWHIKRRAILLAGRCLDGTTNFIHDNAPYCVSIALRSKKELLLGVVYEICRNECFWTYKGAPSYLNGNEIHVSAISNLDDSFIALGFPYATEEYKPMANHLVNTLYGNVAGLRLMGAAAVELCYIAAGRFEARIEAFIGPWDIAAGTIILQNAGGMITDFKGGDSYSSGSQVLASNGRIHRDLLNIIDNL